MFSNRDPRAGHLAFGAVYEHRDSMGKSHLIGATGQMPERQFALDRAEVPRVQELSRRGGMRSELVWMGVGQGLIGDSEMDEVRAAVLNNRSERMKIDKLACFKPYSRHT